MQLLPDIRNVRTMRNIREDAFELIDIAEEARGAGEEALRDLPRLRLDAAGAALAPLAVGDRRGVRERLRRLIAEVAGQTRAPRRPGLGRVTWITVRARVTDDGSLTVRVASDVAWRELSLSVAGTGALDAPGLAQIERYGFLRLAPSTD